MSMFMFTNYNVITLSSVICHQYLIMCCSEESDRIQLNQIEEYLQFGFWRFHIYIYMDSALVVLL